MASGFYSRASGRPMPQARAGSSRGIEALDVDEFLGPLPIKNATNSRRSVPYSKPKAPDVSGIIEFRVPDSAITSTSKIIDEVKMLSGSSHVPSASVKCASLTAS